MREVFEEYLKDVRFGDWEIKVHMDGERPYLQVGFWDYDAALPLSVQSCRTYQKGRKWILSPYMTKSEVVQTAFKAVMTAQEHEARERFTYKGKAVFGPHFNVDVLLAACEKEEPDIRASSFSLSRYHGRGGTREKRID